MPVYRREGSPYWWYSFTIDGCRFRGSTGETAKRAAAEVERDQYALAEKSLMPKRDWTVQAVLSSYWNEHAKATRSSYDIEGHLAHLQRVLGKDKRVSKLTSGDLMDYRAKRRGERLRGRMPAENSINREFAYLHAACRHCERFHAMTMPDVDWKALKAKEPAWRTRFLARKDEAPAFLAALPVHCREIVICAIVTGLRRSNVMGLDWSQISLSERAITLTTKGGKRQTVTIPPALMAILSTRPKRVGRVFDATNFRRHWVRALNAAGIEDFRFHDLRHTFGSWARKAGIDLPTLKKAMNHSNITMTARYANVEPDEVVTTFDKVSATLSVTIGVTEDKKTAENGGTSND